MLKWGKDKRYISSTMASGNVQLMSSCLSGGGNSISQYFWLFNFCDGFYLGLFLTTIHRDLIQMRRWLNLALEKALANSKFVHW